MARLSTKYGNVRELITGSAQYRVPRYQRRYKWRTSHEVLDIWEDILTRYVALVHPEEAADASDSHFLGALVIGQGDPPDPLGVTPYIVIDGQQRIMSLMLALAGVRDGLVDSESDKNEITEQYLTHRGRELRLVPSHDDQEDFESIVFNRTALSHRSAVNDAYRFFFTKMQSGVDFELLRRDDTSSAPQLSDEESEDTEELSQREDLHPIQWKQMLLAILDRLELVTISDVTPENAYQVFRTLNSTGMELSQVDLLRNAFFMLLPQRAEYAYDNLWMPLEQGLHDRLEHYFHTEMLRMGENIPKQQVYRTAMTAVKRAGLAEDNVVSTLQRWQDHECVVWRRGGWRLLEQGYGILAVGAYALA